MTILLLQALLLLISFALILLGMILVVIGSLREEKEKAESRVEAGGVILIGPLPIVIGTSQRIAKTLIILAIVLLVVSILAYLILLGLTR